MRKVNIEDLTQKLNGFISSNSKKVFTGGELHEELVKLGFNNSICYRITSSLFPYETTGKGRLYEMPKTPVYKGLVERIYAERRKAVNKSRGNNVAVVKEPVMDRFKEAAEINAAVKLLLAAGYKVQRPLGLDVKQLIKDHPEMEKVYMRYETIK